MRLSGLLRTRFCLPIGGAAALLGVLTLSPQPPTSMPTSVGIVWVYYASLCTNPGDSSDCQIITVPARPQFVTQEDCAAHRDAELSRHSNPRLMGSCLRQREA
jgi:hypothetical protein